MGHVFTPNAERGIFKTTDGGKSWSKFSTSNANTGGVDLSMDQHHPNVLYASMWQARALSVETHSAAARAAVCIKRPTAARTGRTSRTIPGFATGTLGKIGVSVAQSESA